jgi:hypothetical protein
MEVSALASMATMMQAQSLQYAVSTSVMKMEMDTAKQSAQALIEMMEKSVLPHLGNQLDIIA